jgi:membrane-associated protease RseP (regulator of RpoE activity)
MSFYLGIVLFAFLILVSVALHECGHMWAARATGMKVRRYFVGFGPTLWSTHRPNKLGSTEYGVKAIPLGGFCDIAGMTSIDEVAPQDEPYAMYRQKVWKRVLVLFAGPAMNIIIGLVIIYAMALSGGLPNLHPPTAAIVGKTSCVASDIAKGKPGDCGAAVGPAAAAGLKSGDVVTKVGNTNVATYEEMVAAVRKSNGPTPFVVQRDGKQLTLTVDVQQTKRWLKESDQEPTTAGTIGVSQGVIGPKRYNPLAAVPATFAFTGDLSVQLGKSLAQIPTKMGALVRSLGGGERDPNTPISVVGASIIGGDTVELGLWLAFWFFLASLNFILAGVNLIPLLPFDGGHIAVATYEKVRNMIRSARGKAAAGPVNYLKLMPATYVVLVVLVGYMVLTVAADFINPLRPFK